MELLLAPESWPFVFAVMLVVLIGAIEAVSLLLGASFAGFLDHTAALHWHGFADAWLGWLHVGKVPALVLLVVLLTAFALCGLAINAATHSLLGVYPAPILSSVAALLCALPVVRLSAGGIARLIPKDESSAISLESLVGHVAVVVNGTARLGYAAQARVKTDRGQTLYVHVEPDRDSVTFVAGDSVLLVKQISGARFMGIANPRPDLL